MCCIVTVNGKICHKTKPRWLCKWIDLFDWHIHQMCKFHEWDVDLNIYIQLTVEWRWNWFWHVWKLIFIELDRSMIVHKKNHFNWFCNCVYDLYIVKYKWKKSFFFNFFFEILVLQLTNETISTNQTQALNWTKYFCYSKIVYFIYWFSYINNFFVCFLFTHSIYSYT